MERGLLWLPLLGLFSWLAWAGWNEYQKLEAYKQWAQSFQRAKYDLYAALGQMNHTLTWGRPTRSGPVALTTVALGDVAAIAAYGGDAPLPEDAHLPRGCSACVRLVLRDRTYHDIPFTEADLATQWQKVLQTDLDSLQSTPQP